MKKDELLRNLPVIVFVLFILLPLVGKNILPLIIFAVVAYIVFTKFKRTDLSKFRFNFNSNDAPRVVDYNKINFMNNFKKTFPLALLVFFGGWLFFASIVIVDAGETGVYSLFGKVRSEELKSGFHLVIPLAKVTKMSIRTEEYTMSIAQGEGKKYEADAIASLTKEGLSVDLDLTVLYKLEEDSASEVYNNVGLDYEEKILRPTIRTVIRDVIAQYDAKDIYSEKREEAAEKILQKLQADLKNRGIATENVLLRNVALPERLTQAIQEKLQAEQESQKYEFILEKEIKEKERKIIEAEGQRDAQKIINESLTTNYLYYQYISSLKDREGTIYVPTGTESGMPLFRDLGR